MASTMIFAIIAFTVVLLGIFAYVTVRGIAKPPAEPTPFDELLRADAGEATHPLRILLAIYGSTCSVAAVNDVARLPAAARKRGRGPDRYPFARARDSGSSLAFAAGRVDDFHEQAR